MAQNSQIYPEKLELVRKMEKNGVYEILLTQLEEMQSPRKIDESALKTVNQAILENKTLMEYLLEGNRSFVFFSEMKRRGQ